MGALHHAALIRAYRTLATGLGGSAVSTALVAVIAALVAGDKTLGAALIAAGASLLTTVVSAFGSFWRGVAQGLPEAPPLTEDEVDALFAAERSQAVPNEDGHVRWDEANDKGRHEA